MIRSSIGISKFPVSEEIDPGFGPDTEQRRVEFAAKLEEEAFSIALGDATKLAKANLITALKLWKREDLIPLIKNLELREIMIIWLIFELVVLGKIWEKANDNNQKKIFLRDKKILEKFIKAIFTPLLEDIPDRVERIELGLTTIAKIREDYGGDLIFSLKNKNDDEIVKIHEHIYSKLPQSLRDKFYEIITGIRIDYKKLINILKGTRKDLLQKFLDLLKGKIAKIEELTKERLEVIARIIAAFDKEASDYFIKNIATISRKDSEVHRKVKRYYGIEK